MLRDYIWARSRNIFGSRHLFIYIYGGGLVFCLPLAKTIYFSHFEAKKGNGKEQKGRPKLVVFFGRKVHFPPILSTFLSKT